MALLDSLGSIFGGIGSIFGGGAISDRADALQQAAAQLEQRTDEYRNNVTRNAGTFRRASLNQLSNIRPLRRYAGLDFNRTASASSFLDEGINMSIGAFNAMTDQQRSNLDFSIGGANENLRRAQTDFAALAAGDTSAFNQIVQASAFGALAESAGMPTGAFANTSAKNMIALRQAGVEGAMGISDFFAKQGTVDPIDPIDSTFKLAAFEQLENSRESDLQRYNRTMDFNLQSFNQNTRLAKANARLGVESNIFSTFANMETNALNSYSQALQTMVGGSGGDNLGLSSIFGGLGTSFAQLGAGDTKETSSNIKQAS